MDISALVRTHAEAAVFPACRIRHIYQQESTSTARRIAIIAMIALCFVVGWLAASVESQVVYELDCNKPIHYVVPIQSILGKLPVVPVGDTGTIPNRMRNAFSGAPVDRRPGAGRRWMPDVVRQLDSVGIGNFGMVP